MTFAYRSLITLFSGMILLSATNFAKSQELSGGGWRGQWIDDNSGHSGPLRGHFRVSHDGNYRVMFTGKFAKIIPFLYSTKLNVIGRDGDQVILGGSSRLPFAGRFTYSGYADANHFHADYSSRQWRGSFQMTR